MSSQWWERRDEISPLPHPLGYSADSGAEDVGNVAGMDADLSIGGMLFLSAASDQDPYQRQLRKVSKQQVDQSEYPGDNSLSDWWMRTQTDFSGGAGQVFMEPIQTDGVSARFWASAGVDPFTTPGQVSLLPKAVTLGSTLGGAGKIAGFSTGFVAAAGTSVRSYSNASPPVLLNSRTASAAVFGVAIAGSYALLSMAGKVAVMPVDGSSSPVDRYTGAGSAVPVVRYVKNRTLVMAADKVWEVPGDPDVALNMATATPAVNLHDSGWAWVGAANTPTSILLAGNGAGTGSILSLVIDPQSGTLPTLSAPTVVAELPPNEQITAIATYLGTYVVLATTAGIRVGQITSSGGVQYGPLLGSPLSIGDFTLWDRFAQYPVADAGDGKGGLVRIDLSGLGSDSRAPWATFTRVGTSQAVNGHVILGGRVTVMLDLTGQLWRTADGSALDTGWLETSRVRYGTLEEKNFQYVKVFTLPLAGGQIATSTLIEGVVGNEIGTLSSITGPEGTFRTANRKALSQMGLRFDLTPAATLGPVLEAWSMKSLPAIADRGQQVLLPMLCFDFERTSRGLSIGYEGRAWERWQALVSRIAGGSDFIVKEIHSGASYIATAEDCSFTQVAPPTHASGFGGIINLLLRETS